MEIEDIEKAARQESGIWAPCPIHLYDLYRRDDFEAGFHSGANWRIDSVWHRTEVEPEKNDVDLVLFDGERLKSEFWSDVISWEKFVRIGKFIMWAYKEDLIPNMEE